MAPQRHHVSAECLVEELLIQLTVHRNVNQRIDIQGVQPIGFTRTVSRATERGEKGDIGRHTRRIHSNGMPLSPSQSIHIYWIL